MLSRCACAVAAVLLTVAAPHAQAQLVGNDGWSYSAANRSFHAQGQILHRQQAAAAASAGAGSAIINSSTTVGNIDQISQILAAGATGNVNTNTSQSSSGSQSSNATNNGTSNSNNGVQP